MLATLDDTSTTSSSNWESSTCLMSGLVHNHFHFDTFFETHASSSDEVLLSDPDSLVDIFLFFPLFPVDIALLFGGHGREVFCWGLLAAFSVAHHTQPDLRVIVDEVVVHSKDRFLLGQLLIFCASWHTCCIHMVKKLMSLIPFLAGPELVSWTTSCDQSRNLPPAAENRFLRFWFGRGKFGKILRPVSVQSFQKRAKRPDLTGL